MTPGEPEGSGDTLTASPWVTQERGAGELQVGARADGSNTRKAPSAAADEAGARGRHRARQAQRGRNGGRRENKADKTLGVWGDDRDMRHLDWPMIPLERVSRRGATRSMKWRKTHRGPAREWAE